MEVRFRELDHFNCWIWLRFPDVPSDGEKAYVDGIFDSWYVLGRLGGFNAENLQLHNEGSDLSEINYHKCASLISNAIFGVILIYHPIKSGFGSFVKFLVAKISP